MLPKIAIVLGTRPEIIKMSPVIRECERLALDYFVLHTGQHYSYNMDRVFFEDLELLGARYNLDVGSNILAGTDSDRMLKCVKMMVDRKNSWENPFGDGKACSRTIEVLTEELDG